MQKHELRVLENKIDQLIQMCARLNEENRMLREREVELLAERDSLLEKNTQARGRVEAMLGRLRALEDEVNA